jgi:cyclase
MNLRILARLDIKGPNVVKGIHLEGLRVLGKPEEFAKHYYESGADEIIFQDVVASLYERNSLHEIIEKTAQEVFIPLTVGGGIRTLDDIKNILRVGADKVALNTAAVKRPSFISEAVNKFGSSTIVASIEVIKNTDGQYFAFTDNGREFTGIEVVKWVKQVQDLGVGEIILTSVDRDGTGSGFDIELLKLVQPHILVPLIVHGGAGRLEHFKDALTEVSVHGFAIGTMIHYDLVNRKLFRNVEFTEGNTDFLQNPSISDNYNTHSIAEIKNFLSENNFNIRNLDD